VDKTIVEATRSAAGDDRTRYDGVSMALHWATAILVVLLYGSAQIWDFWPRGPERAAVVAVHVSFGLLLALAIVLRLLWRLGPGRRIQAAPGGLIELASKVVHYALYALILVEVVLGITLRWAGPEPLAFFNLFTIPSPLTLAADQRHWVRETHELIGTIVIIVAGIHAAAALFHHYVMRDDVMRRMLPGRSAAARGLRP
jgi:cytochrome b561